jgi:hypothetical protein
MPDFVRRRAISRDKVERAVEKSSPWVAKADRLVKPRLPALAAQRRLIVLAAAVLAVAFYPLAFVPFGVTAPSLGIVALGLGLMACDGLLVVVGYALAALTAYVLFVSL